MQEIEIRKEIDNFSTILDNFEASLPSHRLEKLKWLERKRLIGNVRRVLQARDQFEQKLNEYEAQATPGSAFWKTEDKTDVPINADVKTGYQQPIDSERAEVSIDERVDELNRRLYAHKLLIARVIDLDGETKQLRPQNAGEWWSFPTPLGFWNRFDWLFNFGTFILTIASLSLATSLIPLFWAGGANTFGPLVSMLSVIAPSVLSILSLEKASQAKEELDETLEKQRFPRQYRQELIFTLSALVFVSLVVAFRNKPTLSNDFFNQGEERVKATADGAGSKVLTSAEPYFKLATAFNQDHAAAHFRLGWLYELRQDKDKAKDEYKLAMQSQLPEQRNNTMKYDWVLLARVRLANLLLLEGFSADATPKNDKDPNIRKSSDAAVAILWQGWEDVQETQDLEAEKSWYTVLGWARLQQQRYPEAEIALNEAVERLNEIINQRKEESLKAGRDLETGDVGTAAYCIRAELYDLWKEKMDTEKKKIASKEYLVKADADWCSCAGYASTRRQTEDIWIGKAMLRCKIKSGKEK